MAATGSNHKERHLAQPPGSMRALVSRTRKLHSPFWVAAVLLVFVLSFVVVPAASSSAETAPLAQAATGTDAAVVPILFPLEQRINWTDTFGAARSGGRTHAGNDLMAPKMTPLLAVADGKLDWMNFTGKLSSYNNLPYYNILLRGDDGNDYFYIHINNDTPGTDDGLGGVEFAYAPGMTNGKHVTAGEVIAYVGDSGNAEDTAPHLHFEIHLGGYVAATGTMTRTPSAIDPYASLKAAPTLAEWTAAGKPPLSTYVTVPGSTTTTTVPTTTTTAPKPTTTTTAPKPTTTVLDTSVPGYRDVKTTDWYFSDFAQASAAGVVVPDPDGSFRPYVQVTRALFATYLVRAMAPNEIASAQSASVFSDVPVDYWAYAEIQTAARLGLVLGTGDGSTFSPDKLVTRAQMATMICRALGSDANNGWAGSAAAAYLLYRDVPKGYWAQGAIVMSNYLGLLCGDSEGCFRPEENANRAQSIILMARLMRLLEGGSGS